VAVYMKVSLVLCTFNRVLEVETFFNSLLAQTYTSFDVIIVDQNQDDRLKAMVEHYQGHFPIQHVHAPPGLSRARNVGLRYARGDVIAFPDDDCEYPRDTLQTVVNLFAQLRVGGIAGRWQDHDGSCDGVNFDRESGAITLWNASRRVASTALFFSHATIQKVGLFDEEMGVGGRYGSSEDVDYVLRAVEGGITIYYTSELIIYHPSKKQLNDTPESLKRLAFYGRGSGRLWRKHYPLSYVLYDTLRVVLGGMKRHLQMDKNAIRRSFVFLWGAWAGWRGK
jgi:glycosyltransferase involved in cell wall biosynthesis